MCTVHEKRRETRRNQNGSTSVGPVSKAPVDAVKWVYKSAHVLSIIRSVFCNRLIRFYRHKD